MDQTAYEAYNQGVVWRSSRGPQLGIRLGTGFLVQYMSHQANHVQGGRRQDVVVGGERVDHVAKIELSFSEKEP
jgi:hypothetical protein